MGEFERAVRQLYDSERHCPACGAFDLPSPAKPTLEREQNGSLTCCSCGHNFRPKEQK
jgi:transcription elongation factor Elf1